LWQQITFFLSAPHFDPDVKSELTVAPKSPAGGTFIGSHSGEPEGWGVEKGRKQTCHYHRDNVQYFYNFSTGSNKYIIRLIQ
jgi:hypothetical protein